MNENATKTETELVLRRLGESFPFSAPDMSATGVAFQWGTVGLLLLLGLLAALWTLRDKTKRHVLDFIIAGVRGLVFVVPAGFFALARVRDIPSEAMWWGLTFTMLFLGTGLTVFMYIRDAKTIGLFSILLAPLRILVYVVLAAAFMMPACRQWEETEKRSRVIIILDVSPSITTHSDEIAKGSGIKPKPRLAAILDFLTDENIAFVQKIKEKNPLFVYRFGSRLDEESQEFAKGSPNWTRDEWEGFAKYDFKPYVLKGLSEEGRKRITALDSWKKDEPGYAEWALAFADTGVSKEVLTAKDSTGKMLPTSDQEAIEKTLKNLKSRVDFTRSIVQGTNVPDSLLNIVNREASNKVSGIIVFSDGRSNMGSDSSISELTSRATREKIPIFTVAVGVARENVSIVISDLNVPDRTQPEEPTKITVEADAIGLGSGPVKVKLGLYLPGRDPKKDDPTCELEKDMIFAPGEPPHGVTEFTLDADELAKDEKGKEMVEPSVKVGRTWQLKAGAWSVVARIERNPKEVFSEPYHLSPVRTMQVIDKPVRVLLFASGPSREYQTLRTLLVREMDQKRAEVSIYLQTEAGISGDAVQDVPAERLLTRFPDRLDTTKKAVAAEDPKDAKSAKYYNLDEYDLIIAFDPDWNEKDMAGNFRISAESIANVKTWVENLGGGLMYVAGPVHTFQLARADETNRLRPLLDIMPVIPEDLVLSKTRGIPREPRRILLKPNSDSIDLLKLEDGKSDVAGWERFFSGREEFKKSERPGEDERPRRGFFSYYPVKRVKDGAITWAEFWDFDDKGTRALKPFIVTTQPARGRTCFLASGETYRLRAENLAFFDRFWLNFARYLSAKRDAKSNRGSVLMNKEFVAGNPIRVQTRLLAPNGEPYKEKDKSPKFEVAQYTQNGDLIRKIGIFEMKERKSGDKFEGYYQGQITADAKNFPPGDFLYKVTVDVPDSPGDVLDSEFKVKKSDPEFDNTRPDFAAMIAMAGTLDMVEKSIADSSTISALKGSETDSKKAKLAYKMSDTNRLELIPQCLDEKIIRLRNNSGYLDLWDYPIPIPERLTRFFHGSDSIIGLPFGWYLLSIPLFLLAVGSLFVGMVVQLGPVMEQVVRMLGLFLGLIAVLMIFVTWPFPVGIVVGVVATLLSLEWLSRKLLRLA